MDGSTFDTIIRSLTLAGSRRHAIVGLLGSALGLLGSRGEEAEAKKGKGKHKKKKKKGRAGCTPICERKVCGSDGCGGSCGECRTGEACASGRCVCVPTCTNRVCGSDGCDGSCGSCTVAGQFCTDAGQCQCPAAIPV